MNIQEMNIVVMSFAMAMVLLTVMTVVITNTVIQFTHQLRAIKKKPNALFSKVTNGVFAVNH